MATSNGNTKQCAIAVEKKGDFCASPPFGWHLDPETGKMKCDDNSFFVMVRDSRFEGRDVDIEVNYLEEVDAVRQLLAKKPILTTAHCHTNASPSHSSSSSGSEVFLKTVDFVVIINTAHPLIAAQLDEAFKRAAEFIKEGKMFRIKIAFSESLRQYMDNINAVDSLTVETLVWNCDIFVTHGLAEPKCADHFFACKNTCQTALWFLCFPCCLFTGFPYILYKKCFSGIKEETIRIPVPVTYHDGPFMTGFDLHSLLYHPKRLSVHSQRSGKSLQDCALYNKFVPGSPPPNKSPKIRKISR